MALNMSLKRTAKIQSFEGVDISSRFQRISNRSFETIESYDIHTMSFFGDTARCYRGISVKVALNQYITTICRSHLLPLSIYGSHRQFVFRPSDAHSSGIRNRTWSSKIEQIC